jgi:UDP-N-acetylmuramoyl-L-alanyl-D-glutamate--2,6-diaminopimelate ligase
MMLQDFKDLLNPRAVLRFADRPVDRIAFHSAEVERGTLFFAVPGTRADGASYVDEALERGAVAIVSERPMSLRVPVLVVEDVRRALADAACRFYDDPSADLAVLGITGTNGKTTVAHMIRHILETDGRSTGLLGTISYEFGGRRLPAPNTTPDPVRLQGYLREMVDRRAQACVMEVSSHALAQERVRGVRFRAGVFLNLTQDHLDYHGTMGEYAAAKARLFAQLPPGGLAILNADADPAAVATMYEALPMGTRVVSFGRSAGAAVRASEVRCDIDGTRFRMSMQHGVVDVHLPLPGEHNVENALAAAATCHALGVSEIAIAHALDAMPSVRGRMELAGSRGGVRAFVDYAHTPDAIQKACAALRRLTAGPLTVVFGCGGDRDRGKRPLMAQAAARFADRLILTSDNPRSEDPERILDEVERGILEPPAGLEIRAREYARLVDRAAAIERAVRLARPDETILVAGKGHEVYQDFGDTVVPFDDREHLQRALGCGPAAGERRRW